MEREIVRPELKPREFPKDDKPADVSLDAVDTPENTGTMRQQNQDKQPSPFKWFVEIEVILLGVGLVVGFLAYWIFWGKG